jgi:HK97 family phage portal protein
VSVIADLFSPRPPVPRASSPYTEAFVRGEDMPNAWGPMGDVAVDGTQGLAIAAYYSCVKILAEDVSTLPLHLYRRLPNGGKERAPDHPLYPMLHDRPNPEMTGVSFWETLMGHALMWGNGFAQIRLDRLDRPTGELWPLRPDRMKLKREEVADAQGRRHLLYCYRTLDGQEITFREEEILHIRGLSSNGLIGFSPIQVVGGPFLLSRNAERFGISWFTNGSRPGGVVTVKGQLSKEGKDSLRDQIEGRFLGASNGSRVVVLEEDTSWTTVGTPPEDAQFIETRKFERAEIAGLFRVQSHLINDLERATFNNIEQLSLEHVVYTIRPWLVRIEQELKRRLLPDPEYFAEFLVDGLLRGDAVGRATALQIRRQNGTLTADEWREIENQNPLPDERGQDTWMPSNMQVVGSPSPAPSVPSNGRIHVPA